MDDSIITLVYKGDLMNVIRQLEMIMLDKNLSLTHVRIKNIDTIETVDKMIRSGFLPPYIDERTESSDAELTAFIDYYVEGLNPLAIEFWSPLDIQMEWELAGLKNSGFFLYGTIEGWKRTS